MSHITLNDNVIIPLDREAILSSKNNDHAPLEAYMTSLVKQLKHIYFETANAVNINNELDSVTSGIIASTTQTQGKQALVSKINEIATVANINDTVTLPTAKIGLKLTIINNGANTLRIFPASSDNLGAGVDTQTTLASGSNVTYVAYDATNWESV